MRLLLCSLLSLVACVKGNPEGPGDPAFLDEGGTIAVPGCTYSLTTRPGAEAPRLATAFGTVGSDPTPRLVHLGWMGDPKTSIVAQWRTVDEETQVTRMRFGVGENLTEADLAESVDGIEFRYRATGTAIYRVHQAHVCNLKPGTTYSYQVGSEGHFSPIYTFHTAPDVTANPDAEVLFGVIGDSRDGYDIWEQLVGQLAMQSPDAILFTGDAVTIGLTQNEWEEWFGRAESLFAKTPLVFAHGNHEVNATPYYSQVALPGDQQNFGFDYGHAHITVANDTPEDGIQPISNEFKTAIAADFEASKNARWRIFMHHQPIYSAATAHGSSSLLQQQWMPLVDQYKIDLVIAGHDHDYEISKPMRGDIPQASNADGTVYAVVGGAGAELYDNAKLYHTAYSEKTHSASTLRVRRDLLELQAFRPDGTTITGDAGNNGVFTKTK